MTPQTKLHLPFRQRRAVQSGEPFDAAEPAPEASGAEAPVAPGSTAAFAEPEPVVSYAGPAPVVSTAMADAAERLHRGYTSPTAAASSRRLAAVSLWALLLVLGGIVVALRAAVAQLAGSAGLAGALLTLTTIGGLAGLGLTIGAFLTIGARRLPWILLGAATAVLFTLLVLSAVA
jgi:hypothetical protein